MKAADMRQHCDMFKWEKLRRVFKPREFEGRTWLHEFAQAPCTLLFDAFMRVYFSCHR
jgi:hypothetical protein